MPFRDREFPPPAYALDDSGDRRGSDDGRRGYDARPSWPLYVSTAITVAAVVWGAAVNVANAATTRDMVSQMQVQLAQIQASSSELTSAVNVLNCKVGITCTGRN